MIGFDTETSLIQPHRGVPRLVCGSFAGKGPLPPGVVASGALVRTRGKHWAALADAHTTVRLFVDLANSGETFAIHNAAFDLSALLDFYALWLDGYGSDAIWRALDNGQIYCTYVREKLLSIAMDRFEFDHRIRMRKPRYSLAQCVKAYFGKDLAKGSDTWRLRYSELDGTPIDQWPEDAISYALDDALWHLKVCKAQTKQNPAVLDNGGPLFTKDRVMDQEPQVRAAFALRLMECWGVRTDTKAAEAFAQSAEDQAAEGDKIARRLGFIRENGTRDLKVLRGLVDRAYGGNPPRTPKGGIQYSETVLAESSDPDLVKYAESSKARTNLAKFTGFALAGTTGPIIPRYNVLVRTGRTSCEKPPLQQPPRKGGFRECFVPRPGNVFCAVDYDQIELCSLAQVLLVMFGKSAMAEAIQAGKDLHCVLAANLEHISYKKAIKLKATSPKFVNGPRQVAKVGNFGFAGGMGANTFVHHAKGSYGVELTLNEAKHLRKVWLQTWPEMHEYFNYIGYATRGGKRATIQQYKSQRQRGGCHFTDGCNTLFQGLTSDGAKTAVYAVAKAAYHDPGSSLYGVRPWLFLHDEIIAEGPEETAHIWGEEMARVMRETMQRYMPEIPVGAEPALMRRWYKGAKTVRDKKGKLKVWEP